MGEDRNMLNTDEKDPIEREEIALEKLPGQGSVLKPMSNVRISERLASFDLYFIFNLE